tara:strand:- start:1 stop:543 length:543 start_codon:yes stop_codon:yes gene_type:complete
MALIHIASVTASSSATLSFTSGIDSTYNEYQFHFENMHPQTDQVFFQFQVNASDDTGGGFDTSVITSSAFLAYHFEGDASGLSYSGTQDLAQSASHQRLTQEVGNNADQSASGILTLYAPASTTYTKNFTARFADSGYNDYVEDHHVAGYINQTLAIPEISFQFHSGNIDAGTIHMYGVG